MINFKSSVTGAQECKDAIKRELERLQTKSFVTVGVHGSDNGRDDGEITNAAIGALHEFGGDINHPGGTSYGYKSKAAADRNEVRFLKSGKGYMELGVTQPHTISIPPRPWLVPGVTSGNAEYLEEVAKVIADGGGIELALSRVGLIAAGKVKEYMTDLMTPPNAPSTIRKKKGVNNPLIDSGQLKNSVHYQITPQKPDEGI